MAFRVFVLTASDAGSRGEREDRSGPVIEEGDIWNLYEDASVHEYTVRGTGAGLLSTFYQH